MKLEEVQELLNGKPCKDCPPPTFTHKEFLESIIKLARTEEGRVMVKYIQWIESKYRCLKRQQKKEM